MRRYSRRRGGAEQPVDQRQRRAPDPRGLRAARAAGAAAAHGDRSRRLKATFESAASCLACCCDRHRRPRVLARRRAGVRRYVTGLVPRAAGARRAARDRGARRRDPSAMPAGVGHVAEPPHPPTNLGLDARRRCRARPGAPRVDLIHAPAYTAPFWAPRAGRADDPRRQLRAPSGVVSLPPRLAAPRVLPAQRARPRRRS